MFNFTTVNYDGKNLKNKIPFPSRRFGANSTLNIYLIMFYLRKETKL